MANASSKLSATTIVAKSTSTISPIIDFFVIYRILIYQKVYKLYCFLIDMEEVKVTNLIKFCTVILLNKEPKHGYEIIKELKSQFGKEISASHVYPFLSTLEKNK